MDASPYVVAKFGGTSVSTRAHWDTVASIAQERLEAGKRPVLVCSAMERVSRELEALLSAALANAHEALLEAIKERHLALASALEVDGRALLAHYFDSITRLAYGISLTQEVGPAVRARILSGGELMLTTLGAAFLRRQGLQTTWRDARTLLQAHTDSRAPLHEQYLSNQCEHAPDMALKAALASDCITLTQGFIARNRRGETVLIGWGGSDTSASYLAAKLEAEHVEIWTDVPGMFTADPRIIPSARLLRHLEYDEAEELASTGAEVLHARCIDPLRSAGIPLHIRSTLAPQLPGTVIAPDVETFGAQVKAISTLAGLTLIAIETPRMWHSVGFLARVCGLFERHGLSIGHVATSETNVTMSIDPIHGVALSPSKLESLLSDLNMFCSAQPIQSCAAVSLVGRQIRSVLHELGPALEALSEQQVFLVTQAASDRNLTFVVHESQAARLVAKLHSQIFGHMSRNGLFGKTYRELFDADLPTERALWWKQRRTDLLRIAKEHSPCYVYDEATLRAAARQVLGLAPVARCFYAMKASLHPDVLRVFYEAGLGFECVSPGELALAHRLFPDLDPERILFTPNFAPREEYETGFRLAGYVTLDSTRPLELWPDVFTGRKIIIRVDPGRGHGHHKHVRTAGTQSKFGIAPDALPRLQRLAADISVTIIGLHAHVGSGILMSSTWTETAYFLASLAEDFPEVRILNIGGGFGVPERPGATALDLDALAEDLGSFRQAHPHFALWMEPGRLLVAESGVLLARVTQVKEKGSMHYVGVETGMNSLIRPALYGAYHAIANLSHLDAPPAITAEVVGPICETGDILGHGRRLPKTSEGDVLLVATAGAYGQVMSTHYNLRPPARECFLSCD